MVDTIILLYQWLFVLPFFGRTLVGTTDTPCKNSEANIPSPNEELYLTDHLKRIFALKKHIVLLMVLYYGEE